MCTLGKRKFPELEETIDDFDEIVEESPETLSEVIPRSLKSPPTKRVKRKLEFSTPNNTTTQPQPKSFSCLFRVTKDVCCTAIFSRLNTHEIPGALQKFLSCEDTLQLRVADFATRSSLMLYQDLHTKKFTVPEFEVNGRDTNSRCVMSYMKGILARKEEIAVIPIKNSDYQLLVFENDTIVDKKSTPFEQLGSFNSSLHAILVKKYVLVLDLDETLIRTRLPKSDKDKPKSSQKGEYEFYVQGYRYICCVRPGTESLLKWACNVFRVYVFTNAIYEYAKEILKILDPKQDHLCKGININDDEQVKRILKSREVMTQVDYIPGPLGLKDLQKFGLDIFETVILDDDIKVWKHKDNLLPFDDIVKCRAPKDFFYKVRTETWKKLETLHKLKQRCRIDIENQKELRKQFKKMEKRPTYSQENVLTNLSQS